MPDPKPREAAEREDASLNGLLGGGVVGFVVWISVWMAFTETTSRPWAKGFQLGEQLLIGVVFILVGAFIGRLYGAYNYQKNKDISRNQDLEERVRQLEAKKKTK